MIRGTAKAETETRPTQEWLRVELTDEEMLTAAKESAQAQQKIDRLEGQLEVIKKQFKSDIERELGVIHRASDQINQGYEMLEVDCEWHYDWSENQRKLIRLDTGEIVKEGKIPAEERQTEIERTITPSSPLEVVGAE